MTVRLASVEDFLARDAAALADTLLDPCPICGRKHPVPFRAIRAMPGAVELIPSLAAELLGREPRRVVAVFDRAIEAVVAPAVFDPLRAAGLALTPFAMQGEPGHLLDSGVENGSEAAAQIALLRPDLLLGAGSGVICDLTKWIATRLNVPFILCGTAASMNGYTSITATMTENGVKVSKFLNPADAVLLDVNVLTGAPLAMTRSGLGDLAARAVCNADWKLSQWLRGTSFCPLPYQMTAANEARCLAAAEAIVAGDPAAMALLAEAILLSGLSMTVMEGETSPSSGAEHVISHFWDLLVHLRGAPKNFHGTQVGVATMIMLNAYAYLREVDPGKIDLTAVLRRRRSLEQIEADCRARFGDQAAGFVAVARKKFIPDADLPAYLRRILDGWERLWAELEPYLAPVERIRAPFLRAGVPMTLDAVQRTRAEALEALLYGNIYRPRYTLLDLLWELGLFPAAAEEILDRAGV